MKSWFKTTIVSNSFDGKFDEKFEKFDKSMGKVSEAMDEVSDSMTEMFKGFDPAKEGLSVVSETDVYGTTQSEALQEANKMAPYGYKVVSLKLDENLKVFVAKLRMEKTEK